MEQLKWFDHIQRMQKAQLPKCIWEEDAEEDIKYLGIKAFTMLWRKNSYMQEAGWIEDY